MGIVIRVRFGEQMIVKAMSILVFPFVGVLNPAGSVPDPHLTAGIGNALWTLQYCNGNGLWIYAVAGNSSNRVLVQPL